MQYTLTPGTQSNYQITVTVPKASLGSYKEAALQQFQKDTNIEWFRPGHAPLSMVEQRIQPEYLQVAIYEEVIHQATSQLLDEHKDKKFIGQIYDFHIDDKNATDVVLMFKIDVYPEIVTKNDARKKLKLTALETDVWDKEIEETLMNIKRQYADYQPAEIVGENSVFKVGLSFIDKDGKEVHTGKLYLGKEDFAEFPQLADYFMGKKQDDAITIPYEEKKLPHTMHLHKEWITAKQIVATIGDLRTMILPEFTSENIKKFFGNDDVTTEAGLREKIAVLIRQQKEETTLMQKIDGFLQDAMKSFDIAIPMTLIGEEVKTRNKSLEERMGGSDGLKKYFEQLGEEEVKKLQKSITDAAKSSLEKFLILREIVSQLEIPDIKWESHLDVEKKLYEKLVK